jgi:hypothetical protein
MKKTREEKTTMKATAVLVGRKFVAFRLIETGERTLADLYIGTSRFPEATRKFRSSVPLIKGTKIFFQHEPVLSSDGSDLYTKYEVKYLDVEISVEHFRFHTTATFRYEGCNYSCNYTKKGPKDAFLELLKEAFFPTDKVFPKTAWGTFAGSKLLGVEYDDSKYMAPINSALGPKVIVRQGVCFARNWCVEESKDFRVFTCNGVPITLVRNLLVFRAHKVEKKLVEIDAITRQKLIVRTPATDESLDLWLAPNDIVEEKQSHFEAFLPDEIGTFVHNVIWKATVSRFEQYVVSIGGEFYNNLGEKIIAKESCLLSKREFADLLGLDDDTSSVVLSMLVDCSNKGMSSIEEVD